jgi:hypothetical protein
MHHRESLETVEFEKDGIRYDIFPTFGPGGFHASWRCTACGESGASSLLRPTREDAIASAERNLTTRHGTHHHPGG